MTSTQTQRKSLQFSRWRPVSDLRHFMGMINQLGKFSPNLSELSHPLRELLSTKQSWILGPTQEKSFAKIKQELTQPAVLCLYNPEALTKRCSSSSLGAILLQQVDTVWRPVAYVSRAMMETDRRYAQIETKELETFLNYILGRRFLIESDHKPLIPLLNYKQLDHLPPHIRLQMARFDYTVHHVLGKFMYIADTLSRAPAYHVDELELQTEVKAFLDSVVQSLPVTKYQLETYYRAQTEDSVCSKVAEYCWSRWPERHAMDASIVPHWKARTSVSLQDGLLLYDQCPCKFSARGNSLSNPWRSPGYQALKDENWPTCAKEAKLRRESLLTTKLPGYPWQVQGSELKGDHAILACHWLLFSVPGDSETIINHILQHYQSGIFSWFGMPEVVHSDNSPQYASTRFEDFAMSHRFRHDTSSLHYLQCMVLTAKCLLKRYEDSYLALLSYWATPLPWFNLSPA